MIRAESLSTSSEADPFGHRRRYVSDDGRTSFDCSELLPESPRFSLAKLALFLSRPVLLGEFLPDAPWQGVSKVEADFDWPAQASDPQHLTQQFRESVAACVGESASVAVIFSGGLDSTAVLVHAASLCRERGAKLFAITADLEADEGRPTREIASGLIRRLDVGAELHVVGASFGDGRGHAWSHAGPRLDAMPELNRAIADFARGLGAEVMLNGSGSDELLGTVRYLLPSLVSARRYGGAAKYAAAALGDGAETAALEALSLVSRVLPRGARAQLYWSSNWPELADPRPSPLLAEPYRSFVADWTADWLRRRMKSHAALRGSWALADAWDSLFPHDVHLPASALPERSPFLTQPFTGYALGLPLECRYDERLPTDYQRRKSLVMRLIPEAHHDALPKSKIIYSKAFSSYHTAAEPSFKRCLELGLFEPGRAQLLQSDPALSHNARSVEMWVRGAEEFGAAAACL